MTPEILTQAPRRSELLNVEVEALERSPICAVVVPYGQKWGKIGGFAVSVVFFVNF